MHKIAGQDLYRRRFTETHSVFLYNFSNTSGKQIDCFVLLKSAPHGYLINWVSTCPDKMVYTMIAWNPLIISCKYQHIAAFEHQKPETYLLVCNWF